MLPNYSHHLRGGGKFQLVQAFRVIEQLNVLSHFLRTHPTSIAALFPELAPSAQHPTDLGRAATFSTPHLKGGLQIT